MHQENNILLHNRNTQPHHGVIGSKSGAKLIKLIKPDQISQMKMSIECIHQMCCSEWSSKLISGWRVEFKYPMLLWIKVLCWKWRSSLSPIQPRLCGWAHLHDACVCLLCESYSSQTKPPLHLHPVEPPGVLLQAFPRALWQLLYSNSPCMCMIPLKINPLQNCPAHAIIHKGMECFWSVLHSKWSPILSHHINKWNGWREAGRKRTWGSERSYLIWQSIC